MSESEKRVPQNYDRDSGFFNQIIHQVKLTGRLVLDKRVSPLLKLLPIGAVVYFFAPDLLPGPFDDAALAWLAVQMFVELCPPEIVQEHLDAMYGVIPGQWKVSGTDPGDPATGASAPGGTVMDAEFRDADDGA